MKHILMIGTGGTIASEMSPDGLTPEISSEQLLAAVPRIGELCKVDCLQLYSLDSTSLRPAHWQGLARAIRERYDDYDGFVVSHGTDTMAYTAAALSYLIQGSPKPIVLTGAQKPIWFDGTDSKRNLTDAFLYACRGCGGVQIVFNGKVILGTRARKTFSKSFQAFSSVNFPDLAARHLQRLAGAKAHVHAVFPPTGGAVVAGGNDLVVLDDDSAVDPAQTGGTLQNGLGDVQVVVLLADAVHNFPS